MRLIRDQWALAQTFFLVKYSSTLSRIRNTNTCRPSCLRASMEEVRKTLDHKLLNRIEALETPTLENLSRFIWERVQHAGKITRVSVHRDSCNESCTYFGPQG